MRPLYELLLRLYPQEVRTPFGPEMSAIFLQLAEDRLREGWPAYARFVLREYFGLLKGAAAAHRSRYQPVLDLRMMRPPDVSRADYADALDEVLAAQKRVAINLNRMQQAISRNDFVKARFFSDEDRKARANLRLIQRKYGIQ